jgi:hypothetical protein
MVRLAALLAAVWLAAGSSLAAIQGPPASRCHAMPCPDAPAVIKACCCKAAQPAAPVAPSTNVLTTLGAFFHPMAPRVTVDLDAAGDHVALLASPQRLASSRPDRLTLFSTLLI